MPLFKKTRKLSNNSWRADERILNSTQSYQKEGNIKDGNRDKMQNKTIQNILWTMNKTKYFFFENIDKIDRSLAVLRKEKTEVTKINLKVWTLFTNFTNKTRITKQYYRFLHADKLDNLPEIAICLESIKQAKLTDEEMELLDRPTGGCNRQSKNSKETLA